MSVRNVGTLVVRRDKGTILVSWPHFLTTFSKLQLSNLSCELDDCRELYICIVACTFDLA